jgi:hypothetical protein
MLESDATNTVEKACFRPVVHLGASDALRSIWDAASRNVDALLAAMSATAEMAEVRPSGIPGAGNGLFARRVIHPGECLGCFKGVLVTRSALVDRLPREVWHAKMHYCWNMTRLSSDLGGEAQILLDPTDEHGRVRNDCLLAFANECSDHSGNNLIARIGPDDLSVRYYARRRIMAGEELLVYYGGGYTRVGYSVSGRPPVGDGRGGWVR